jgi:succinoglycan biosynthesis transport protein ExoP
MREEFTEPESQGLNLPRFYQLFQRHKWWVVLPGFLVFTAVWTVSWFIPALYRSETLILVEQQKVPSEYVVPNISDDLQQRLQSMTQQILSRTRLMKIIDQFDLYPAYRKRWRDEDLVERMRKDVQIDMVQDPGRPLSAFKIAYLSKNPRIAQAVTTELASLFIDENLRVRQERSEDTTEFLDSELEQARHNLSAQEIRVREFKSHYLGELPGQVQSNVQILSGLQSRLQQEMEALSHAKEQKVYLESMLTQFRSVEAGLRATPSNEGTGAPSLDAQIDKLQDQLADLTSRYSDEHPDVKKVKAQLATLRRLREERDAKLTQAMKSSSASAAPDTKRASSYAELQAMSPRLQLESELKANQLEINHRGETIRSLENQIDSYQGRLNTAPLREQQLADLTRDYDQSRRYYEGLLAKRDQSSMATSLEKRQQGEQFQVIDPANIPQKPDSPNRLKLALIGLAAGLACALGCLAGVAFLDDVIYLRDELQDIIPITVLAEIPPLLTPQERAALNRSVVWHKVAMIVIGVLSTVGLGLSYYRG